MLVNKSANIFLVLFILILIGNACCDCGKTHILYHCPPSEMKISSALKAKDINVPIFKIGVGDEGKVKIALIQIGISKRLTRSELARNVLEIIKNSFKVEPTLDRIDIYGSDRPDTKKSKGDVLFSISALQEDVKKIDSHKSSLKNLRVFGLIYISDKIKDPVISWRKNAMKQIHKSLMMKEKAKKKSMPDGVKR